MNRFRFFPLTENGNGKILSSGIDELDKQAEVAALASTDCHVEVNWVELSLSVTEQARKLARTISESLLKQETNITFEYSYSYSGINNNMDNTVLIIM